MEITVEKAIIASKAIESIKDIKLPAKLSYRLGRLSDKLTPIVSRFDKLRNELVTEKYGSLVEGDENKFSVPADKMPDFLKEISDTLLNKEDIGEVKPINIDEFGDIEIPMSFFSDMDGFIIE